MTPEQRLEELIAHGAAIQLPLHDQPMLTLTLAGALWLTDPKRLRWCAIFPEHQGHVHELRYTRTDMMNDGRDIAFYRGPDLVAGVVPYEEGDLETDEVRAALAAWRDQLGRYDNVAQFAEFLEMA
ncbi:hypothetical protein SH528x_002183 [Novipirellula sp. SH528]|uniref:hypothetical protein n=1 Tax=Novipirellula sp. SH528 TaxID=3454466 RepID=UPI003FA18FF0